MTGPRPLWQCPTCEQIFATWVKVANHIKDPAGTCNWLINTAEIDCTKWGEERTLDIIERLHQGETLKSIGSSYGISRERVRQLAGRWFELNGTSLAELRFNQKRTRDAEALARQIETANSCIVCGEAVLGAIATRRTCSKACAREWQARPWRYDDGRRKRMRLASANWHLAHPEVSSAAYLRHAQSVVDNPDKPFNRRYRTTDITAQRLRAVEVIEKLLADGPRTREDIRTELEAQGFTHLERLLTACRRTLDIHSRPRGFGPGHATEWSLPS